jgi:hypothetical protein
MLKKVAAIIFALLLSGSIFAQKVENLAEGKALATKLNKPLLLDFMTDW